MAYPASADVFPTILSSTKRNDPGFELDLLLNRAFDAIEALEAGLGTGSSGATPSAGKVRRATGTGTATWGQVETGDLLNNAVTIRPSPVGGTTSPTTTNTTTAALANPTVSITIPTGMSADVYVWINGTVNDGTGGALIAYSVRIASGTWNDVAEISMASGSARLTLSGFHCFEDIAAGTHLIEIGNRANAAYTITHYANQRRMLVIGVMK